MVTQRTRTPLYDEDTGEQVAINHRSSCRIKLTIKDFDKDAVTKASLLSLDGTLKDIETGTVINDRASGQANYSLLDDNGGTVNADGSVEIILEGDDTAVQSESAGSYEEREFVVKWQWRTAGGATRENSEVFLLLINPVL